MARSDTLAPGFLVASPKLDGGPFERAVVVVIHHDTEGAMGFIINKPLELDFGSLLEMVDLEDDVIMDTSYDQKVFFGGPVRVEQLWVIHHVDHPAAAELLLDDDELAPGLRFHDEWALTGAADSIQDMAAGRGASCFRPYIGYAGWGPGQLEEELADGSWLALDFDEMLVFEEEPALVWDKALAQIGVDETTFMLMGKLGSA